MPPALAIIPPRLLLRWQSETLSSRFYRRNAVARVIHVILLSTGPPADRSMLMLDRLGRLFLVLLFPFVVGHAVDRLACFRIGQLDAALLSTFAIPTRQAIAAEAGEIHQIEILHVGTAPQMVDQLAERAGFELG